MINQTKIDSRIKNVKVYMTGMYYLCPQLSSSHFFIYPSGPSRENVLGCV
jgi:hypothetical protein